MIPLQVKAAIGAGVMLAAFIAGWYVESLRWSSSEKRAAIAAITKLDAAYKQRDANSKALQDHDAAADADTAALRQLIVDNANAVQNAVRGQQLVEERTEVIHDDTGSHACPDSRRSTTYRVCWNASVSGDPAAIAACEAERRPFPLPRQ